MGAGNSVAGVVVKPGLNRREAGLGPKGGGARFLVRGGECNLASGMR
jgi:hypothetical protein